MADNLRISDSYIDSTLQWLRSFVVAHNICPFAARPLREDRILIEWEASTQLEQCLERVILECQRLDRQSDMETTLLIYPNTFAAFEDYLDFLYLAEDLLALEGYEGVYQLASFHPDYCFEGNLPDDPANRTNRSPYPMLHFLREESVEKAIQAYGDTSRIPARNIAFLRSLNH